MKKLMLLLLILFDLAVNAQTPQITQSRYVIPSGGASPVVPAVYFPNIIVITTNGVTALAGNSYTMTYSAIPAINSQWDVYIDAHHLTTNAPFGSNITIFGRQPFVDNPNIDTVWMHFTVLQDSTGNNPILDMKYVSQAVQLQTLFGNLTVKGALTVNGITTLADSAIYTGVGTYSGAPSETNALAVSPTSGAISKGCYLICGDSLNYWRTHGNSGLSNANFVGNTDSVAVNFRVNNKFSGTVDMNTGNTGLGYEAFYHNTTGTFNCALGYMSLTANTTGSDNTGVGGIEALGANTTGSNNTGIGEAALQDNTTGGYNTALGGDAAGNLTTGSYNTFLGYNTQPTTNSTSYAIGIGTGATASTNQLLFANVRVASFPYMTSAIGDVLTDTSGTGDFIPQPPFGLTGTTFTPVTGDSVTVSKSKNTVNPSGTIANFTLILPASPVSWQVYEFTFLQAVTALHWSHRLSGGTVSAGIATAITQYQSLSIYWNPTLSEWVLF